MHGGRHRHTGFKAVSTGQGVASVIADLIRNPGVKGGGLGPSFPRRRESTGWMRGGRHRHTGFKAVSTGWGMIQGIAVFLFFGIRICRITEDFQDCDDASHRFHPHPSPLPSRERGMMVGLSCCHPALWIADYVAAAMTGL